MSSNEEKACEGTYIPKNNSTDKILIWIIGQKAGKRSARENAKV
jgi:hypothetical protein